MSAPETGELLLRTAHQMIVENDDATTARSLRGGISRAEVMAEIRHHLAPFQVDDNTPITGATVISGT
jgi:hypothetical protein